MLEKIFESINSEILTDEVKLQMSTLFEAAVNKEISDEKKKLKKENEEKLDKLSADEEEELKKVKDEVNENLTKFKSKLVKQLESYVNYFTEQFLKENRKEVISQVEVKEAEKIINLFKEMNMNFGIGIGNLVKESNTSFKNYKNKFNKVLSMYDSLSEKHIALESKVKKLAQAELIKEEVDKMNVSDFEKEKITQLMDNLHFKSVDELKTKAKVLKEFVSKEGMKVKRDLLKEAQVIKEKNKTKYAVPINTDLI